MNGADGGPPAPWPHRRDLEPTTKRVLQALSQGLTPSETATVLGIATGTVNSQTHRARSILGAKTTTQAVAEALRRGLIT